MGKRNRLAKNKFNQCPPKILKHFKQHFRNLSGLYKTIQESAFVAESVNDSNGTYFIPAFSGLQVNLSISFSMLTTTIFFKNLQAPYNDTLASSGFIGMRPTTTKAHMARALLESLAFRVQQLLNILETETDVDFDHIKYDVLFKCLVNICLIN